MRSNPRRTTHSPSASFESLKEHLATQAALRREKLHRSFPHVGKKFDELGFSIKHVRHHSAKALTGLALAGGLIMGSPAMPTPIHKTHQEGTLSSQQKEQIVKDTLQELLPQTIGPLSPQTEKRIGSQLSETLGMRVSAQLDGHHLNTTYGRMGGEQHLPRFPGDTIGQHDELQIKGITASRGAFGYFAQSKDQLTDEEMEREKYYVAVQTLYLPDWNQNYKTLKEWYKWRKVLVVNPTTGKSVVAVVGDAGPAAWTGKHFGGSPEVMAYLQPYAEKNAGRVVLFFVDDPTNQIALGPADSAVQNYLAKR